MNETQKHEEFFYRGVKLLMHDEWKERIFPILDFIIDNGGLVSEVKERFFGLRFYYKNPENGDPDLWDGLYEMIRLVENRSGEWKKPKAIDNTYV